jgi:hypothetical protein
MIPTQIGARYKVTYRIEGVHRVDRVMVADFLGAEHDNSRLYFSGRPMFGTAELAPEWIVSAVQVPSTTPIVAPKP